MYIHFRVRRWVMWWFYVGVVCGALAVANILGHHFTGAQDRLLILLGVAHWLLGGIVCWAFDGIRFERNQASPVSRQLPENHQVQAYSASEFLLPGNRQSILPWRH